MRKYSIVEEIFPKVSEHEENINNAEKQKFKRTKELRFLKEKCRGQKKSNFRSANCFHDTKYATKLGVNGLKVVVKSEGQLWRNLEVFSRCFLLI